MQERHRKHLSSLERRRDRLQMRLGEPNFRGNPDPQLRELAGIKFAIHVITECDRHGMLEVVAP